MVADELAHLRLCDLRVPAGIHEGRNVLVDRFAQRIGIAGFNVITAMVERRQRGKERRARVEADLAVKRLTGTGSGLR
jgi:hypothetical protein